jgi:CubicO group peptidase (beta-lactamase class C family)
MRDLQTQNQNKEAAMPANKASRLKFEYLCNAIAKDMQRLKVPGVSVGLWYQGREFSASFGVTSVENPLPVTPDTLFQVGSISKTFTGTALMQLAEQGQLDPDTPVKKYLKDLRLKDASVARRVTTRHLLTHTGGWVGDYFNDFGNGDDALAKMVKSIGQLEQVLPLGKMWSYNNTGFNIASRVLEVIAQKPYEKAVQEMLLDPLALKMTYFFPSDLLITHRFVVGHYTQDKQIHVSRPWAIGRAGNGVGGVVSTVKDLLKYARFHMRDGINENGKRVMQRATLAAMRVPLVDIGGFRQMGITWFIRDFGDFHIYSHGGATNGQQAGLFFSPENDFALAILTNSNEGGALVDHGFRVALDLFCGAEIPHPKPLNVPAAMLKEYVGRYHAGTEAFDLKVKQGQLIFQYIPLGGFPTPDSPPGPTPPPSTLGFYERDKIIGIAGGMKGAFGEFFRDAKGRVKYLRIGSRVHPKVK